MKNAIQKILKKSKDSILFAYLFGSHAQGISSKNSDIDIAVFLNENTEAFFDVKIDLYLNLTRVLNRNDIDLVIMNNCRNIILLNSIITYGSVVYSHDDLKRINYEQKILHSAIDFRNQRKMAMGI